MSTSKTTAGLAAAIALLLAVSLNLRVVSARSEAEAALAAAQREVAERLSTLNGLRERERAADQALAAIQVAANEVRAANEARAAAAATRASASAPVRTPRAMTPEVQRGFEYLAKHPDLKRVLVERSRARVASWYSPIYRELSFTPEQREQFETLLMEEQGIYGTFPEGPFALLPGKGLEREEMEQQARELLGPVAYEKFLEVSHTIQARRVATDLAAAGYQTETPLTSDQLKEIVRVVSLATASTTRTGPNYGGLDPAALISQLKGTLSPVQLQALAEMDAQLKLNRAMAAATRGAGAGTPNPPAP